MYKRREDGTIVGVLIDFEPAILSGSQSTNIERTGTMPFMAFDILASIVTDTPQQHLYRHDAESFLWVAIWVCGTYEGGIERQDAPFNDWTQGDARHCRAYKIEFLTSYDEKVWSKSHQARVDVLRKMCYQLYTDDFNRRIATDEDGGVDQPEATEGADNDHDRIERNLFSTLRKELGE